MMTDPEIRALLRPTLPTGLVIEELGILQGVVRADVALVTDLLHGYEIKSAADSRARLALQAAAYSRVFDRCTVVVEPNHLRGAIETVPPWWGALVVVDGGLRTEREGAPNEHVEARAVAELLWSEDVIDLLEARRAARGYRGKPRWILWARLCEVYTSDEVREHARRVLRERHEGVERKSGWMSAAKAESMARHQPQKEQV